jgi:hypothetical protein
MTGSIAVRNRFGAKAALGDKREQVTLTLKPAEP